MKHYKLRLKFFICIFIFWFVYSATVCAGTYVYDEKDSKKQTHPTKQPAVTQPENNKKDGHKRNQPPAGIPYKHKEKDKKKKTPEKFK